MTLFNGSRFRSRSFFLAACFVLSTFYVVFRASGYTGGISGTTNRPGDKTKGCTCHCIDADPATTVTFNPAVLDTTFVAGGTYQFKVTVTNASESQAGVNIAAWKGKLSAVNSELGVDFSGQLFQSIPKALNAGSATWTFKYKAPVGAAFDTLYATGNAVNGDGRNGDGDCSDGWNRAPKYIIKFSPSSVVEPTLALTQSLSVSPNPSSQQATLSISVDRHQESLVEVYDVAGRRRSSASVSLDRGNNSVTVATTALPNGIYFVKLRSGSSLIASSKLIVQH